MAFTNNIISETQISLSTVIFKPLSVKYLALQLKLCSVMTMIPIFILVVLSFEWLFQMPTGYMQTFLWWISAVFIVGMLIFTYILMAFEKKGYALRTHDLHYCSGLFFQSHVCQPILRIQHIEVKRGPLERRAGLASVAVYSAGGALHTFVIPGLEYDTAIALRSYILQHRDLKLDESDDA